jgi:hypothetical protein
MFESAEVGHKLDKAEYEKEVPKLREALLETQYDLFERGLPDRAPLRHQRRQAGETAAS